MKLAPRSLSSASVALPLALAFATAMPVAHADEPTPEVSDQAPARTPYEQGMHDRWDRMIQAELVGGADTPWGVVGGAVVFSPIANFALDVGGGASRDGARVATGARLVLSQDHFALVMRLGLAGGALNWSGDSAPYRTRSWSFIGFLDADVGVEYRFDGGPLVRLFGGVETGLSDTAESCTDGARDEGPIHAAVGDTCQQHLGEGARPVRVYLGISIGYAFEVFR